MRDQRLSMLLFSGMACVLFVLLAFSTVKNALRDKDLIRHNALSQGDWMVRSLEIGHRMMMDDHVSALREILQEVEQKPHAHGDLDKAAWVLLGLDVSEELAHYRASVLQQVAIAIREKATVLGREREPQNPEIVVNVGINTGPVLLGATMMRGAVGEGLTYTASGMVTNLAARLCEFGVKGEIHLSEATAKFVSGHCMLQGPLEVNLRHIQGVMLAYQVA